MLPQVVISKDAHYWSKFRGQEMVECSALNETSISYLRHKPQESSCKRGQEDCKREYSTPLLRHICQTWQDPCTEELIKAVGACTRHAQNQCSPNFSMAVEGLMKFHTQLRSCWQLMTYGRQTKREAGRGRENESMKLGGKRGRCRRTIGGSDFSEN